MFLFNKKKESYSNRYSDPLNEYIDTHYDNKEEWFVEEVKKQQARTLKVTEYVHYLNGGHKIKAKDDIEYKGHTFVTKKTVFNEAKNILDFSTTYLLGKKPTLTGTEEKVKVFNNIYRKSKYYNIDFKILDKVKKFGDVGEYIIKEKINGKSIPKSYIIQPEDFYPVYDDSMELVSVIEYWFNDESKISYYRVYTDNLVYEYTDKGGYGIYLVEQTKSYGLPIHWHNMNDDKECFGKSELDDIIPIIDDLEAIINRLGDSVHTVITNPILAIDGELKGEDNSMNVAGVGYCIITDGGKIYYPKAEMDYQCIKLYLDILKEELNKVGAIPSAAYGQSNIANISETVIKQLYQIASNRATMNEMWLREGLEKRWEIIDRILMSDGVTFNDDKYIDIEFNYNRPQNDTETVENIVKMRTIKAMSQRDSVESNPLTPNVDQTLQRLEEEKSKGDKLSESDNGLKDKNSDVIDDNNKEKIV